MAVQIDKQAIVDPGAELDDGCVLGPFCRIGSKVRIGRDTRLRSHVVVNGNTTIGESCDIFPFTTLGMQSQDAKYVEGSVTYTEIGSRTRIREFVSVHSGTEEHSVTRVGDDCYLLAQAHVAHNCTLGNHVVMSHAATLGGHVTVDDHANIGGLAGVHQFCTIGRAAMVAGMGRAIQDVLPFTIAEGFPAHMRVVNKIGMQRAGYSSEEIAEVRKAFRILFMRNLRLEQAVELLRREFSNSANVELLIQAIGTSQRGIARPDPLSSFD